MNCQEFVDFLMAYLDDDLERQQRGVFESHMVDCPGCKSYLDTYEETIRMGKLACGSEAELPEDVPEALVQAILAARHSH